MQHATCPKRGENACDKGTEVFTSDLFRKRRQIFKPIMDQSKAKQKQTRITFENQLRTALGRNVMLKLFYYQL